LQNLKTPFFSKASLGELSPLKKMVPVCGGNSHIFLIFIPNPGGMMQFDEHVFQMGWKPPTSFQIEGLGQDDKNIEYHEGLEYPYGYGGLKHCISML